MRPCLKKKGRKGGREEGRERERQRERERKKERKKEKGRKEGTKKKKRIPAGPLGGSIFGSKWSFSLQETRSAQSDQGGKVQQPQFLGTF
jgi:hypothetical protein